MDVWASGEAYEPYIGRWSQLVAQEFLAWISIPRDARWLDVGCGTGALTDVIAREAHPAAVQSVDPSPAYIAFARRRVPDPRAAFIVADARLLPQRTGSVDVAVSGLALNFIPRPEDTLAEIARVVRAGGVAAAYVWDYAERMQLIRHFWDAAVALDPEASSLDEARRFPDCNPAALDALFRRAGYTAVETRAIDVPTRFRDFDDFWTPFLGGQGPAPGYAMSLSESRRAGLRERLRATLPAAADGSIDLIARVWAVRGIRT
jgi:SAM-dependent methyltransferase